MKKALPVCDLLAAESVFLFFGSMGQERAWTILGKIILNNHLIAGKIVVIRNNDSIDSMGNLAQKLIVTGSDLK